MKGKKTGGRLPGSQNRLTGDLRAKISQIVENQIDAIESDLSALKPIERLQIFEKLLAYCVPKLQSQTFEINLESLSDLQINQIIENINLNENENENNE